MKEVYILAHRGWYDSQTVAVVSTLKKARRCMEIYAKYVEWNFKTEVKFHEEDSIEFSDESRLFISKEKVLTDVARFKKAWRVPEK